MSKINSSVNENLLRQTSVELTLIDIFFQHSIINTPLLLLINFARLNGANMFRFVKKKILTVRVILLSDIFVSMRL